MDIVLFTIIGATLMQGARLALPYYIALIALATIRVLRIVKEIRKTKED